MNELVGNTNDRCLIRIAPHFFCGTIDRVQFDCLHVLLESKWRFLVQSEQQQRLKKHSLCRLFMQDYNRNCIRKYLNVPFMAFTLSHGAAGRPFFFCGEICHCSNSSPLKSSRAKDCPYRAGVDPGSNPRLTSLNILELRMENFINGTVYYVLSGTFNFYNISFNYHYERFQ